MVPGAGSNEQEQPELTSIAEPPAAEAIQDGSAAVEADADAAQTAAIVEETGRQSTARGPT